MPRKTKACKYGTYTYFDNDYIGLTFEHAGVFSDEEVQRLLSLIDKDSIVVDAGAHIGAFTIPMAQKTAHVYAFEPQRAIFELLQENVRQNNLANVTAVPLALGASNGPVRLSETPYDGEFINTGMPAIQRNSRHKPNAEMITLYRYWSQHQIKRLDLLKMDVEGWELEVLKGIGDLIKRFRPTIYCENGGDDFEDLIRYLIGENYTLYWHFPRYFNPFAGEDWDKISMNMLCVPKDVDRKADISGLEPVLSPREDWQDGYVRGKTNILLAPRTLLPLGTAPLFTVQSSSDKARDIPA